MIFTLLIVAALVLLIDLGLIVLWQTNYKNASDGITDTPFVSILVAARNEQDSLAGCLESILTIDYPDDKFEILVGNDMSDDQTGEIADAFSIRYPQVKSYNIYKQTIEGNGKANVLAQLVKKAKGEYLFITDADIRVPHPWIKSMLLAMKEDVALVTGTSVVVGSNILAYMQQIDWLFATGMLKVVSDLGIPVTTMGNNMLLRKSVYEEIGGYEALPFSVTEDLELFNHIKEHHRTVNLFNPGVLNESKPEKSLNELLKQRKRWMRGAFELPTIMVTLLAIQASFFVIILGLLLLNPIYALAVLGLKFTLRYIFVSMVVNKLNDKVNIFGSLIFEFYTAIFSFVSLIYYFIPGPIEWKGRKY
jgi:cellulose synthase/poly-beta-1,6-N-acetylglucosamine synthase-like glycosyltransferase